jgi:hypothetical protein
MTVAPFWVTVRMSPELFWHVSFEDLLRYFSQEATTFLGVRGFRASSSWGPLIEPLRLFVLGKHMFL